MSNDRNAFFSPDGDYFVATAAARGPWSGDACHAGPAAGLLARAAEAAIADKQLVRLTANFLRPVPMSGVRVDCEVNRDGRIAANARLMLIDREGKTCATANTTHIVVEDVGRLPTPDTTAPARSDDEPEDLMNPEAPHGQPFFFDFVETRGTPGASGERGPRILWMRTPALVAGETPSPFQRVCPLGDCGNGISANRHFAEVSCVNPDVTIALHRLPASDWLASEAVSHWQATGIGLSQAILYDDDGAIGAALQSLVLRPR